MNTNQEKDFINMKLTKENIYINLQGKSKEELNLITEITGVENLKNYYYLHFYTPLNQWIRYHVWVDNIKNKTEVTIQQLKEILQPMENKESLQQQLEKAKAELERLEKEIEDSKIKIGDWVCNKVAEGILKVDENYINHIDKGYHKITNPQLIILLEQEIK